MKNTHTLLALSIALIFGIFSVAATDSWVKTLVVSSLTGVFQYESTLDQTAAAFFAPGITVAQLQQKYNSVPATNHKIRILLVPGHEPNFGGTEYVVGSGKGKYVLREREMNVALTREIAALLQSNPRYEVIVPRDNENWAPDFSDYFKNNWAEIRAFIRTQKAQMSQLVQTGQVRKVESGIVHNRAANDAALRLFGINKWANENDVDLTIHVHFNDINRKNTNIPGDYSGFTIYVPDSQYSNSSTTKVVADSVFKRLSKYNAVSDLPKESAGIVEEQDLIAIGTANSADSPSMLIEYGYIYEGQFQDADARILMLKDLALDTYLGVQDFFGEQGGVVKNQDSTFLPHAWKVNFSKQSTINTMSEKEDLLALQTALISEGLYPPAGESKHTCPRVPRFGACVSAALAAFQQKYGITGEKDVVGEKTRAKLNELYSLQLM